MFLLGLSVFTLASLATGTGAGGHGIPVLTDHSQPEEVRALVDRIASEQAGRLRDEHVRSADFFDVEKYPTMTYRSTGLRADGDGFILDGELSLRDVTRPVPLKLEIGGFVLPDPSEGGRVGFTATGEISRLAFGVGDDSPIPGAGGLFLSDKTQVALEIQAALEIDD
jgi:polyisoprenoid-binding protein YceI